MTSRFRGAHPVDAPDPVGGLTGRDGSHLTDAQIDAWVDAWVVPDAATLMPTKKGEQSTISGES